MASIVQSVLLVFTLMLITEICAIELKSKLISPYGVSFTHKGNIKTSVSAINVLVSIKVPTLKVEEIYDHTSFDMFKELCESVGKIKNEAALSICLDLNPVIVGYRNRYMKLLSDILTILSLDLVAVIPEYRFTGTDPETHKQLLLKFLSEMGKDFTEPRIMTKHLIKFDNVENMTVPTAPSFTTTKNYGTIPPDYRFAPEYIDYGREYDRSVPLNERIKQYYFNAGRSVRHMMNRFLNSTVHHYRTKRDTLSLLHVNVKRHKRMVTELFGIISNGLQTMFTANKIKRLKKGMMKLVKNQIKLESDLYWIKDDLQLLTKHSLDLFTQIKSQIRKSNTRVNILSQQLFNLQNILENKISKTNYTVNFLGTIISKFLPFFSENQLSLIEYRHGLHRFLNSLDNLMNGQLTQDLIPTHLMRQYLEHLEEVINEDYVGHEIIYKNVDHYYSVKDVEYFYSPNTMEMIIGIPVYIQLKGQETMQIFDIDTTYVPLNFEQNIRGPYSILIPPSRKVAFTISSYMHLDQQQLDLCSIYNGQYLCTYSMLYSKSHHSSCLSTLYFEQSEDMIAKYCKFELHIDIQPPPKILQDNSLILLSQVETNRHLICKNKLSPILKNEKSHYIVIDKSSLCQCSLIIAGQIVTENIEYCTGMRKPIVYKQIQNKIWEVTLPKLKVDMEKFKYSDKPTDVIITELKHDKILEIDLTKLESMISEDKGTFNSLKDRVQSLESDDIWYNNKSKSPVRRTIFYGLISIGIISVFALISLVLYCKLYNKLKGMKVLSGRHFNVKKLKDTIIQGFRNFRQNRRERRRSGSRANSSSRIMTSLSLSDEDVTMMNPTYTSNTSVV